MEKSLDSSDKERKTLLAMILPTKTVNHLVKWSHVMRGAHIRSFFALKVSKK
jgi:hypothetical protein